MPERCDCGALLAPDLDWCSQCYTPSHRVQPQPESEKPFTSAAAEARLARERSRASSGKWDATTVTYGLVGRVVGTVLMTLPLLIFLKGFFPFGFVGVVTWMVVFPRGLRELWRRADRL